MNNYFIDDRHISQASFIDASRRTNSLLKCIFEITTRCNNNCRHCYINVPPNDHEARKRELSADRIVEIAEEAASMGALFSTISGGEPFLRDDFSDIYIRLREKGFVITLMTNAALVTADHVRLFQKYPPGDIEVTVYGITESTYERVTRCAGSFDRFMRGLHMLLSGGVKVRLKAMALRSNVHELKKIAEFCRDRTKDYFRFDPWLSMRNDGDPIRNSEISSERLPCEDFVAIEMSDGERREALTATCNKMLFRKEGDGMGSGELLFTCGAGACQCQISPDGIFQLCSGLQHPECRHDLRNGSLADAYRNLVPKVRAMRSRRQEFVDKCGRCSIIDLCAWCPGHAHLETGEMDKPIDYFCQVAHARAAAIQAAI